ncbi:MAG: AAA family ATPase [Desulfomonile tiedjei]|nr:AAA family ATPase [Desulfomonile tiedjei]
MKCVECGFENREAAKFCKQCGKGLQLQCPSCAHPCDPGSVFCDDCGHDLRKPKEARPLDYDQPHSYTPKHLAEKILTTRSSIEGERKIVTILFADVANSTAMFENLDPESVHEVMDGCFRLMMDEIHRYEGTINQFRGDGLMALFGAPIAHEDHAQRACYAALATQKALKPYRESLKNRHGIDFTMRIGLNSGPVVVGSIGDDLRMDYTAQGDTANLAARMESNAQPGGVLVSNHIYRQAKEFFEFEPMGELHVKGKEEPVEAYRLVKPTEVETRIAASAAKGLTRFVGRDRETETLKEAFDKVQSGEGQVVGIVGEAGVGKSRLLLEFRNLLPKGDFTYFEGRCLHYGGSMPYLPILDVTRSFIGVKEGEQEHVIRQKLKERILGLDENLAHIIPPCQELLSLKADDEEFAKLEPKQKREKTFEAIRDLLIRGSQDRPLVLVVEDLHWIDKTTEEFLTYMIGWLPRTRILLLLLYRPEYTHQWGSKSYYTMIGVGHLSTSTSAELVAAILEGGDVVPELRELILKRAAGNPLFMEELTHSLLQNGSIQKKNDRFVLARDVSSMQVPETIQGIIAARMDRLEESLKRIMQVAAVIGREFAFRILETITEMKEELKSGLVNLQGLEFIYEKSLFPDLEYIFRHALVQEVAYNSLLINRRKEIHERIGRAIESLYPQRLEEFCEMLAYHYSKSGNAAKAYEYLKASAEKTLRNDAAFEAVRFYKEAMEVLSHLPPTDENKKEQIDLVLAMQMPWRRIGYSEDYLPMLQKAEAMAEELGDERERQQIRSVLGVYYIMKGGDPQLAWKYLESCMAHPEIIQDVELMVPVGYDLCTLCAVTGDYRRVNRIAPTIISLIETSRTQAEFFGKSFNVYAAVFMLWGVSTSGSGNFDQGENFFEKALSFAREINHTATLGAVEWGYGCWIAFRGNGQRAAEHLENGIRHLEESQTIYLLGHAWAWLGYANCLMGQFKDAVEFAEKGLKMHADLGMSYWRSMHHWFRSYAKFELGDMGEARTHADLALQFSIENKERQCEGIARAWLGRVVAKTDPAHIEAADQQLLQGISMLEELGAAAFYCCGYLWLGEVYAESGRLEEALETLKKAETMLQEMKMDYWLGKAQEALARL